MGRWKLLPRSPISMVKSSRFLSSAIIYCCCRVSIRSNSLISGREEKRGGDAFEGKPMGAKGRPRSPAEKGPHVKRKYTEYLCRLNKIGSD